MGWVGGFDGVGEVLCGEVVVYLVGQLGEGQCYGIQDECDQCDLEQGGMFVWCVWCLVGMGVVEE